MKFEIDFLPVGNGEKSGDAIALRYSSDGGESWRVGVVDGGTKDSGKKLASHIAYYYDTNKVDFVVLSHPDGDHASGLTEVIDRLEVGELYMHRPWEHVGEIFDRISDGRITIESLKDRLKDGCSNALAVEEKANSEGIPIFEPFSDELENIHGIRVLGPSREYYIENLPEFRAIAEVMEEREEGLFEAMGKAGRWVIRSLVEDWDEELLANPEEEATSSENRTSTVLCLDIGGVYCWLTGDAGVGSLEKAMDKAEEVGINPGSLGFFQVPHHGSKRNLGPDVLDKVIGKPGDREEGSFPAYISASIDGSPKHPSPRVVNALIRRGGRVVATQGKKKCFSVGTPDREGWLPAESFGFMREYEEEA